MRIPSESERIGLEDVGRVIAATPAQVRAIAEAEAAAAALNDGEVALSATG